MQDKRGCKAKTFLPRIQAPFSNKVLVELPIAKHFIQEDEPQRIADAIATRFIDGTLTE